MTKSWVVVAAVCLFLTGCGDGAALEIAPGMELDPVTFTNGS
jgi:hypothetical protein